MKIYMAVTNDKYELPVVVADSVDELSKYFDMGRKTIYSLISRGEASRKRKVKFYKLEI